MEQKYLLLCLYLWWYNNSSMRDVLSSSRGYKPNRPHDRDGCQGRRACSHLLFLGIRHDLPRREGGSYSCAACTFRKLWVILILMEIDKVAFWSRRTLLSRWWTSIVSQSVSDKIYDGFQISQYFIISWEPRVGAGGLHEHSNHRFHKSLRWFFPLCSSAMGWVPRVPQVYPLPMGLWVEISTKSFSSVCSFTM